MRTEMVGVKTDEINEKAFLCENAKKRLIIRVYNTSGNAGSEIDVLDIFDWFKFENNMDIIAKYRAAKDPDEFPGCPVGCTCPSDKGCGIG
jgi:hypothetical protein